MIVVSDTSPISYLVRIGVVDALPKLFDEVFVPSLVLTELRHQNSPARDWALAPPSWLKCQNPVSHKSFLELDEAESQAILLAIELGADQVLMDERRGREVAQQHNLDVVGTLAIIIDGARQGLFDGQAALERLQNTNFYLAPRLWEEIRRLL